MPLLLSVAFVAGVVTVLSPCILPILPVVLASATGGRRRPLAVIIGLVASFAAFTLVISQVVMQLGLPSNVLRLAAVVVIGLLGLSMIVPALSTRVEMLLSRLPGLAPQQQNDDGWKGGLLTGATLGLVWAPCAGPILAAITTLAATQRVSLGAVAVALTYSVGVGLPLLAIAYGGHALLTRLPALSRHTAAVQKVFGGLMIVTAALIAFNVDVTLSAQAANLLPADWSQRLTAIETDPAVINELRGLANDTGGGSAENPVVVQTPAAVAIASSLPNMGKAPEFAGISNWINSTPLTMAGLRGKVVLVDFWTYSCINCIRTLPYVTQWYERYKDQGFVIVGVHTPEFGFEHETANVTRAVQQYNIAYPVAQDNVFGTWSAFDNIYWPAKYLIDAQGNVRYTHFGEGDYDRTERAIQSLLAEAGRPANMPVTQPVPVPISSGQSPETYVGMDRQGRFVSRERPVQGAVETYSLPASLSLNEFAVSGQWVFDGESASERQTGAKLVYNFRAKDVYLVMTSAKPVDVKISIDAGLVNKSEDVNAQGVLTVSESRLYHLVGLDAMQQATVTLEFSGPDVEVYAFTFGS
jgi:cytochrome c biogenesis protein CcdA/thiol-disulfide isomerase/thioredoxin